MNRPGLRSLPSALCAMLVLGWCFSAAQATDRPGDGGWVDPVGAAAEIMPLAAKSLLLDVTRADDHYVAVGARGDVLLSRDGQRWRQVEVPTRTTFTAVTAIGDDVWAVGHAGVIAHSGDGGEHWTIQRKDPWHAPAKGKFANADPKQGAPLLDVLFVDARHGFAVGAYSLALRTEDGGAHWQPMAVSTRENRKNVVKQSNRAADGTDVGKAKESGVLSESEMDLGLEPNPHLNAITRTGSGALFIVGERGAAFRSRDEGMSWQRLQLSYDGSMFSVVGYEGDHVVAFGLRGHVFETTDLGDHWTQLATDTELSLMGGTALPDDGIVIVGANGIVLRRKAAGQALRSYVDQSAGIVASVVPLRGSDALLLVGEHGASVYTPHGPEAK